MINKTSIFEKAGLEEVVYQGESFYQGADGKFYSITVSDRRVELFSSGTPKGKQDLLIGAFRIYPDDDMVEIMSLCLKSIIADKEAYMKTYNDKSYHVEFIRKTLGRNLGKLQIENLCIIYYETVRIGDKTLEYTDLVKDVLRIHAMPISKGILPEFHELLLKISDVYYDFVLGMERTAESNYKLQERCIKFLQEHPDASSSDAIICASILNADLNYTDEWIQKTIDLVNYDSTFAIYGLKHGPNEIIQANNQHDWHIFDVILDNKRSYTFRQVKSLVFADYRNLCFRAAMVTKVGDDMAMLFDIAEGKVREEGVYEGLISYLEKLVIAADVHNIVAFVNPKFIPMYEELGYELSEDEIIDNPYEIDSERTFMWKKLD